MQNLFEVTSAFGTVGLSIGTTLDLGEASEVIIILIMYIGRLGPLTMASLWFSKEKLNVHYTKETITIVKSLPYVLVKESIVAY